ncbi:hypothetical protein AHF37_02474 [Paragonimus kellicotti]|nr:hypothetical protein AHF37_02474 [Paragonimus kellicotti]
MIMRRRYAARRDRKRAEKVQAKAKFADYLRRNPMSPEKVTAITSKPYMELVQALKQGEINPEEALLAYQHKAFEGCESYAGMAYFLTGPAQDDAVLVTVLKSLGAVPFVRTTVPQAMLSVLSSNPIDGTTLNPLDPTRSPAGSSSGEAALIGGGGSGLGFGTDLGGSIRLPAAMCNIVGFKPTPCRLSQRLMLTLNRLMTTTSSCGPLARDVDTCIAAMKALCDSPLLHKLDYFNPPLPYSTELPLNRPLRIGFFTYDGSFTPVPAAQRAVLHVKEKLEALGHKLIPWRPPYLGQEWLTMFLTALVVDGGLPLLNVLKYDVVEPTLATGLRLYKCSWLRRYLMMLYVKLLGNPEDLPFLRACCTVYDIPSLMQHTVHLKMFRQCIYDHWNEAQLDAVICPAFGMAAPIPVTTNRKFTGMLSYQNLFNITNMPAGCLPSGIHVSEQDLTNMRAAVNQRSVWHQAAHDLQLDTLGFSVSVQVAAAPWRDELCLHVMREVEKAVQS